MKLIAVKIALATAISMLSSSTIADDNLPSTKEGNSIYQASFFDQYTPQNAMSMISRIPGFSFDSGSNARGFGGSAGNVLIDGARPTSKSDGLRGALERIPASQVLRIEILRGGAGSSEAAGHEIVANVIKKAIETSGTWGANLIYSPNDEIQPQIEASIAIKLGEWDSLFDMEIAAEPEYRTITRDNFNANNKTSHAQETLASLEKVLAINGEGSRPLGGGKLTLNTAFRRSHWHSDKSIGTYNANRNQSLEPDNYGELIQDEDILKAELGIDWVKEFGDWKFRAIALTSTLDLRYKHDDTTTFKNTTNTEHSQFSEDSVEKEHIARITYAKISEALFKPEFGVEIANNSLNTQLSLIENNEPQTLEGADVIEELRGEIFANFTYQLHSGLTLEGGLTAESSEIKVSGDIAQSQTFNFIKPRLSVNYSIDENSSFTFVANHIVEQLDFNDFAASTNSSEDRTTSGNTGLKPEQASTLSAVYDWRFSDRGNLNIESVYEFRKDIHEQVFLPSGNQGLGNAGDAELWYVKTNLSLPVDPIIENGLLDVYYSYKGSEFYDPIINDNRVIYNYIPHYLKIDFRQDVLNYNFSWGLQFKKSFEKTRFYVDEVQINEGNNYLSKLFVETTRFWGIKTRLEVKDINVALFTKSRFFYQNDRSGTFEGKEITYRERAPEVELSFSSSF